MSKNIKKQVDAKNSELKITISIDKAFWKNAQEQAFKKLSKNLTLKGYRKGKVPAKLTETMIPNGLRWEEAIRGLLNDQAKIAAEQIDFNVDQVLGQPTYNIPKISDTELDIEFIYPIAPIFKVPDYKSTKIKFKTPSTKELDELVEKDIEKMLSKTAVLKPKKPSKTTKIDKGDTVIFDFTGFVNGKELEGGVAEDYELVIGSNIFIPGFEESLIGKPVDFEGDIKVKFPKDYHVEDLKNADAKFMIKVKEVKYHDLPKLSDEFIKSQNIDKVSNEKELRDYLKDLNKRESFEKARVAFSNEFYDQIVEKTEMNLSNSLIEKEIDQFYNVFEKNLKDQKISINEYMNLTKKTKKDIREELKPDAIKNLKKAFIQNEIQKLEKITLTDKDFDKQYSNMSKLYNVDVETIKKTVPKDRISQTMIIDKTLDKIITFSNPEYTNK